MKPGRYAAIDIGTVTCRLLVADVDAEGRITEAHRDRDIVNLGQGVDATGRLAPEAIERVGRTIDRFAESLEELRAEGPVELTAVATSAARDASNSDELIARLARAGVELNIIPGDREAALSFGGATATFPGERVMVIDAGGGSTEIIAGQAGCAPAMAHSFNVGCRRVTEKFLAGDPPTPSELADARLWIDGVFGTYFDDLRAAGHLDNARAVAVGGTATSAISIRERMEVYDSSRVQGALATCDDVDELVERLAAVPLAEREKVTGLEPARAPVIVAGLLIIREVLVLSGLGSFTASETDILHGVVLDAAFRRS